MTADTYWSTSATDQSMALLDAVSPVTALFELDVEPGLDARSLERAWRVVVSEYPIIAARLESGGGRPSWSPGEHTSPIVSSVDPDGLEPATQAIRRNVIDPSAGPMARLHCIDAGTSSRLVLAFHHAAMDGRGALIVLDRLRVAYAAEASGRVWDPTAPATARTVADVLTSRTVPLALRERIVSTALRRWSRLEPSTHRQPATPAVTGVPADVAFIDVGDLVERTDQLRKREGWTMTMLLFGIFEWAWNEAFGRPPGPSGWLVTNDLRARLEAPTVVGNLSGAEPVMFSEAPASPLVAAAHANRTWNAMRWPGLAPELMASTMRWPPAEAAWGGGITSAFSAGRQRRYTRVFSNLGRLPTTMLDWGPAGAAGILVVPPLATAPYVAFGVVTVGGRTLISTRTSQEFFTAEHAARLGAALEAAPVG